jgi:hypothetical protein
MAKKEKSDKNPIQIGLGRMIPKPQNKKETKPKKDKKP